ncbi:MAG: 16S rRNA (uracil(1498)-N(3))-methyltransferase [Treponema sp.]|jgi:16S rRNA (uracil1498-N3)-methyltransferase|nr:16S rRNA (uracil(1498)-N(3))-methyltransferase [Treponema sp.]
MKQFILNVPPNSDGMVHLYGGDYHYLVRVRRLRAGSVFTALLPGGAETRVKVLSTVDNILIGECQGEIPRDPPSLPPIILFQGLPKGTKMDLIVRQAAEGGISEVVPFESEYSAVKITSGMEAKLRRWERIIREARQQSGSAIVTAMRPPCAVRGLLEYWESLKRERPGGVGILLHPHPLEQGSFHGYLYMNPGIVVLAVGPEGGFSPAEADCFADAGFKPLTMGNTILRTETAALYGAAAIRIILLESASWAPMIPKPISPPGSG